MLRFKLPDYSARVAQTAVTISSNVGLTYAQLWTDDKETVYYKPFEKKEKGCLKVIEGRYYIATKMPYNVIRQTGIFRLDPTTFNGSNCFKIGARLSR